MASNNPNQRHSLQTPTVSTTTSSSGGGGGVGIGRSAPICTVGPPPSSLPGGMSTPTLVKSKLALTAGRQQHSTAATATAAPPEPAPAAVAYATRNPRGPLPPQRARVPQQQPPPPQQPPAPPNYPSYVQTAPPAPSGDGAVDPVALSRSTTGSINDPVVLARQSPGSATAKNVAPADAQPHIVPLPPPTQTAFHPLDSGAGSGKEQQQQQSSSVYQNYNQQQQQQQHQFKLPPPTATSYKQPLVAAPKPPSPVKHQRGRTQPSTPDEEVDAFLRGDVGGGDVIGKLCPSSLPPDQTVLEKARTLASRRAWGDVVRVTNDALIGKEMGMHHCCYSELLAIAGNHPLSGGKLAPDVAAVASGSDLDVLRREMCELLSLRFVAQLKLRRYVDLGTEATKLGLMPHLPDHGPPEDDNHISDNMSHVRAISGMSGMLHDGTAVPLTPGTPGTLGTMETDPSIDMLSSSPVPASTLENQGPRPPPLAWKEGSTHPDVAAKDTLPAWVPFGLRILAARQLQYNDGSSKAIDVLYDLRDRAERTDYWNTHGMEMWKPVIDNALVNAFVRKREWRLALKSLEDMMGGLEASAEREVDWWCDGGCGSERSTRQVVSEEERRQMKELVMAAARVELLSRQLLILLQSGAVRAAELVQDEVRLHSARVRSRSNPSPAMRTLLRLTAEMALIRQAPHRLMVNEGLLLFARCNYTDASKYFRDALDQQRLDGRAVTSLFLSSSQSNAPPGCPTWKDQTFPTLGFDAEPSLIVECLNNVSLCLLYSGNMRSAVQELEGLIREDPCRYLTEGVAFNLCTLYELGSDGEECARKKRLLQRVAKRFYLHDVGVESFRLG